MLRRLAQELAQQEDEIGMDESTLLRMFESKASQIRDRGIFTFD